MVDKKITHPKELFKILDNAVKEKYPVLIVAEGIEQEALTPVIRNKLRGALKAVAIKAPAFGELKSHCLDDIAILTGGSHLDMDFTEIRVENMCKRSNISIALEKFSYVFRDSDQR